MSNKLKSKNKPPFKIGQVWRNEDGGEFTVRITDVDPLRVICVTRGDSSWEVGEGGQIFYPNALRRTASVINDFNDYLKAIEEHI